MGFWGLGLCGSRVSGRRLFAFVGLQYFSLSEFGVESLRVEGLGFRVKGSVFFFFWGGGGGVCVRV